MKSTTTARMPETTLIRVTLSISSPQRGLAPLALQFPSTTFVDWLLDSVWLSCCLQVVHLHIPSCYWPVRKSEQLHSRGSRTAGLLFRNRAKAMRKDAADPSRSTPDSESGRKKKYTAPQFAKLTPEEAKAMLTARGLPDSPVVRQLLEWVAELEKRPGKK